MAFGYYSAYNVQAAQVPSTQTDFPVLVNVVDARFKTTGNGGHVQNASGFDIRPYTNGGLGTAITGYELERYNASTGEVVMWVKVSSLSSSSTPFVLAYGDSGITTDGSSTTTWSNSFLAVWHLKNGTVLSLADSTTGGFTLSNNNTTTATVGQIDGGAGFASASSQSLEVASGTGPSAAAMTISVWAKATTLATAYSGTICRNTNNGRYFLILVKSTGKLGVFAKATADVSYDGTGATTLSTGTWYYLTATYSSAAGLVGYLNASVDKTVAANGALDTTATTTSIGNDKANASRFWNGVLDEARAASVVRSADWISTEYNNQNAPGTFATLGNEVSTAVNSNFFSFYIP